MQAKQYAIKHSSVYFAAGRNPSIGLQVLLGRQGRDILCVFFDDSGEYLRYETRAMPAGSSKEATAALMRAWMRELGVAPSTIHVREFCIKEQTIGIRDAPEYLQNLGNDPSSESSEEVELTEEYVACWKAQGRFVLVWDEEYEMTADGDVDST